MKKEKEGYTKFCYFTYFLNSISQTSMFPNKKEKNEILKEILENKMEYKNMKADMIYIFHKENDNFLHGKIGRKSSIRINIPAERDFVEKIDSDYPNCSILFNLNNNPIDGQRIAFEYNSRIFQSPEAQIKAFSNHLNSLLFGSGYAISINPIVDQRDFWEIVKRYQGKIEKLTFSYAVPNLFEIKDSLSEELKKSAEKYGSTNVNIGLENKAGLVIIPENDKFVKESIEYTGKGGGEYRLKIKNMSTEIRSTRSIKTKTIDGIDLIVDNEVEFKKAIKNIFDI